MNANERKALNTGLSFSSRLIAAIFITVPFHMWLRLPLDQSIICALIVAFFPNFLYRTASKILQVGGRVVGKVITGGMKAIGSILEAVIKALQNRKNKKK